MAWFKNLGGQFTGLDGEVYKKGEVFEDHRRLHKAFPTHFQKVPRPVADDEDTDDEEVTTKSAKPTRGTKRTKQVANPPKKSKTSARSKERAPETGLEGKGVDVTEGFTVPDDTGIKVFEKGGEYFVYEGKEKEPANLKGLAEDEVNDFVESLVSE